MPKVKITLPKKITPAQRFMANVQKYSFLKGKKDEEIATAAMLTTRTYSMRKKNPEMLRFREMMDIARTLDTSIRELMGYGAQV